MTPIITVTTCGPVSAPIRASRLGARRVGPVPFVAGSVGRNRLFVRDLLEVSPNRGIPTEGADQVASVGMQYLTPERFMWRGCGRRR